MYWVAQDPTMPTPLQLICTDFDGTLHSDFTEPPVPHALQTKLAQLQAQGATWVINTGRTLDDLRLGIDHAKLTVHPDYVVVVEREIFRCVEHGYEPLTEWNDRCTRMQSALFASIADRLPELFDWVNLHFSANVYEDEWSPFCLIARNNRDADAIQEYVDAFFVGDSQLTFVRNDIYGRLSHTDFTKGTALTELARQLGIPREGIFVAGDHWNDLSMLQPERAEWLVSPANSISEVLTHMERIDGFIAPSECGDGVLEGLEWALHQA
tara:strand:- start:1040 stop:1843 length:804 start_codon:yes stop_codon:yes gene_type:complete